MEEKQIENLLRIKGINAQGFGTIAKLIVRDERLSIESKMIYSYISAFAGSGTTAFPSVATMIKELGISETRFYRHRLALIELNYIEITRERGSNRFGHNVYELIQNPIPLNVQRQEAEGINANSEIEYEQGDENTKKKDLEETPTDLAEMVEHCGLSTELTAKICD